MGLWMCLWMACIEALRYVAMMQSQHQLAHGIKQHTWNKLSSCYSISGPITTGTNPQANIFASVTCSRSNWWCRHSCFWLHCHLCTIGAASSHLGQGWMQLCLAYNAFPWLMGLRAHLSAGELPEVRASRLCSIRLCLGEHDCKLLSTNDFGGMAYAC